MRVSRFASLALICGYIITALPLSAESKNPSDYPLRIHVFYREQATFYRNRAVDEARGQGRANLFENGQARGVDFSFDCSEKLNLSFGFETYPAKWKKPQQELVVLLPNVGKSNSYTTCNFKTSMRDDAYVFSNGRMRTIPIEQYKSWMQKHEYDPEHGKNMPTNLGPQPPTSAPAQ